MRSGIVTQVLIGIDANNNVVGPNPHRRFLSVGSSSSAGMYVFWGTEIAINAGGDRLTAGQPGVSISYEDVGDLVTRPMSIWNAGSATYVQITEGVESDYGL